jgi:mannose-6-phosphate isomerase-like protein (cupin superfamily)
MTKPASARRRIEIFRAADAVDNGGPQGIRGGGTATDETRAKLKVLREAGRDDGIVSSLLFHQKDGFSIVHLWVKPGYPLPRHSHDSDCLYYIVNGEIEYGIDKLRASDGFFVPEGVDYVYVGGPEGAELIEVRFGVNNIETALASQSDGRYDRELALIKANHAAWLTMTMAPTFAANLKGREQDARKRAAESAAQ